VGEGVSLRESGAFFSQKGICTHMKKKYGDDLEKTAQIKEGRSLNSDLLNRINKYF
jgi:hypothetical protein